MSQPNRVNTVVPEPSFVEPKLDPSDVLAGPIWRYLFGSTWDCLLVGGMSLIVTLLSFAFLPRLADVSGVVSIAIYTRFLLEMPHFMATYFLFYRDRSREIFASARNIFLGIGLPTGLAIYFAVVVFTGSRVMMEWAVHAMFISVGHHYVKQFFGVILHLSSRYGFIWQRWDRLALRAALYPLWMISFVSHNHRIERNIFDFQYGTLNIPDWLKQANQYVLVASATILAVVVMRQWIVQRRWTGLGALTALVSLYVWALPLTQHPILLALTPAFHSMQYLTFFFALKKGEAIAERALSGTRLRHSLYMVAVNIGIAGTLVMWALPTGLDDTIPYNQEIFGPHLFLLAITLSINLHHYALDHFLWRRDHPQIQKYLT